MWFGPHGRLVVGQCVLVGGASLCARRRCVWLSAWWSGGLRSSVFWFCPPGMSPRAPGHPLRRCLWKVGPILGAGDTEVKIIQFPALLELIFLYFRRNRQTINRTWQIEAPG